MTGVQSPPRGRRGDPQLGTVRLILSLMMVAALVITAAVLVSTPLLFAWRGKVIAELSLRAGTELPGDIAYAISGAQLLIAFAAILGFYFIRHLRRIIDTVADGDPFIPANAVRLNQMAWLAVAVQCIAIPAGALAGWVAYISKANYIDVGVSFSGVLLALILFVLARVFGQGAQMRDELEGTV